MYKMKNLDFFGINISLLFIFNSKRILFLYSKYLSSISIKSLL